MRLRRKWAAVMGIVGGVALLVAVVGLPALKRTAPGARLVPAGAVAGLPASRSSHLVVIVMENKSTDEILGRSDAPYFNRLARRYTTATASHAIRHPSLPNYLALTGGSTFGVTSDCTACRVDATNLVDQLEQAGISWNAYMEDLPSPCFRGAGRGGYDKKHDPFLYYRDIADNRRRCTRVVPFGQLGRDLRRGTLPTFVWITPNVCDDTHDCGVREGDRFLAGLVPALLRELGPHGALILTWDEGRKTDHSRCCGVAAGGRIATIIAGPHVRRGARLSASVDHYGVLRTIEQVLDLPLLRGAACRCAGTLHAAFIRAPVLRRARR